MKEERATKKKKIQTAATVTNSNLYFSAAKPLKFDRRILCFVFVCAASEKFKEFEKIVEWFATMMMMMMMAERVRMATKCFLINEILLKERNGRTVNAEDK